MICNKWRIFRLFESVVKYFDAFLNLIPLSFVLGFYVSYVTILCPVIIILYPVLRYVASRWWQQFLAIPWPDKSFHTIACYIPGWDEESRILRRSLLRQGGCLANNMRDHTLGAWSRK